MIFMSDLLLHFKPFLLLHLLELCFFFGILSIILKAMCENLWCNQIMLRIFWGCWVKMNWNGDIWSECTETNICVLETVRICPQTPSYCWGQNSDLVPFILEALWSPYKCLSWNYGNGIPGVRMTIMLLFLSFIFVIFFPVIVIP